MSPRLLLALALFILPAAPATAEGEQPNFVFILVDDLGWRDLGCYGSNFYETPSIDGLAAEGVRFTQAYAACPVCSPTRASILTGKYPQRVGITDYISPSGGNQPHKWNRNTKLMPAAYADHLALEELTLAERLKKDGYATSFAGKWHLGSEGFYPEDQGFDHNFGGYESGGPYGGKKYFSPYGNPRLSDGPAGEHLPARLAEETSKFIEVNKDGKFLAYLSFYSVHTPLIARDDLIAKYQAKARTIGFAGPRWIMDGFRLARQEQDHAVYAGMVEAMDQAVGRVLRALEENDLADNTVVFLMSDNGGLSTSEGSPTSNLPLRGGKGWMYEGGIREPMIVRGHGGSGRVEHEPVTSVDFLPTILEMAGLGEPEEPGIDGVSLVPLLDGEEFDRGPLYWHYPHYGNQGGAPSGAIRDGRWKLIEWYEDGKLELFDLESDPGERYDRARQYPQRAAEMRSRLALWRDEVRAKMPAENKAYRDTAPSGRLPGERR